jgi:DNA-binding NarL/FixJ family response regulator
MQYEQVSQGSKIRVLIADNSQIHIQLLASALKRDPMLEVVIVDCDSRGLIAAAVANSIDVLVISPDLDEQSGRGFEVLRELRAVRPAAHGVVLLASAKPRLVLDAFRAGARGVFNKHESVEALCKCVRCVSQGQIWANSEELGMIVEALASSPTVRATKTNGLSLLTKRESDVVQSVAEGLTNREIAEHLGLSQHTVKNYLFRIFDKLGASNRVELLFMTLSQGDNSKSVGDYSLQDFTNAGLGDEFGGFLKLVQRCLESPDSLMQREQGMEAERRVAALGERDRKSSSSQGADRLRAARTVGSAD